MSLVSEEIINDIRNKVDIVDVIGNYLPLTPKGKNYFGVCPFHDDHSPSMSVNREKQIYTCFSCGATGNVFKFVMDYENISFPEALKILADKAHITLNLNFSDSKKTNEKIEVLYKIYETAQKFYQNNLQTAKGKKAKDYLIRRDFTDEIIKEFGIGLALTDNTILSQLILKKGYTLNDLNRTGLSSESGIEAKDIYYNRIMFPLWNIDGRIVGYSGRIYNNEDTAKYINTRETEIFKKGELLYNYHRAKEACRLEKTVVIVEGFMDVIKCYSIGIKNIVATMGTAITKEQANLIKRIAKNVVLCFDGDKAGEHATVSCAAELLKIGVIPKIVRLENDMDPDEYVKKQGPVNFKFKLDNPMSYTDFRISYCASNKNFQNNEDVAQYITEVVEELVNIEDDTLRSLSVQKIHNDTKIDINLLEQKLNNRLRELNKNETEIVVPKKIEPKYQNTAGIPRKYVLAEQIILFYMLKHREVIVIYNNMHPYFPTKEYRYLAREISRFYEEHNYINLAELISFLGESNPLLKIVGEIEQLDKSEYYKADEIEECINAIKEFNINNEKKRLMEQLKKEIDPSKKAEIALEITRLKKEY